MAFSPIHVHLLIKARSLEPIRDPEVCKEFLTDLVYEIGMKPATVPQARYITEEGNEGLTASINLYTSHAALHSWDNDTQLFMMDVYSCTCFDPIDTVRFISDRWMLTDIHYTVIDRNDNNIYDEKVIE